MASSAGELIAVAAQDDEDDEELEDLVEEAEELLNVFWGTIFSAAGVNYPPPKLVVAEYDQRVNSRCFKSRGVSHSYCPADRTVYLDYDNDDDYSLETLADDERHLAAVLIMAHEWGHHIQNILGLFTDDQDNPRATVDVELQADCLAGLFIRAYAKASDWVERADLEDTLDLVREVGDDPSLPKSQISHGTPNQRAASFQRGYRADALAACGL